MKIRNKSKKSNGSNNNNNVLEVDEKTAEDTVVVVTSNSGTAHNRKLSEGEAALTARNYRLAKELVSI
jgi:hypothetical protein